MNVEAGTRLPLLHLAVSSLDVNDVDTYLNLKRLLNDSPDGWKGEFKELFSKYYGLNVGGLTDRFKAAYFEELFEFDGENVESTYKALLERLYRIPRINGSHALPCSFASKLIAIHDESWPIFDRHVSNYFGLFVPRVGTLQLRIEIFVDHMQSLRKQYAQLKGIGEVADALNSLTEKYPSLLQCHFSRQLDFLVWTIGKYKLWKGKATT